MDSRRNETLVAASTGEALESLGARRWGWAFLLAAAGLFAAMTLPVIINGAPLLDDFTRCLEPHRPGFWSQHFAATGAFRPMRVAEIGVINVICRTVPFSLAILIPWLLTLSVAFILRAFLRDLDVPPPWPEIGAGVCLLAPLGTESSLWPSALHIPLGLALALLALRMFKRGRVVPGLALTLVGYLSLEQLIFALPLAAWWVSAPRHRLKILAVSVSLSLAVIAIYATWPGTVGRLASPIMERTANVFRGVDSYAIMVGTGLGAHSIPTAIRWALPASLLVMAAGLVLGWVVGPRLLRSGMPVPRLTYRSILLGLLILALVNIPVALTFPHPDSPRVFTPSWLALAAFAALIGWRVEWRSKRLIGAVAGVLIACSVLSLALSSWVRIRSSHLVEAAMSAQAAETPNGGVAAVCGVTRTVVQPAPSGDFSIHEFLNFANEAYEYYTGKVATIRVGGTYTKDRCPDLSGADAVFEFQDLIRD
jgi:hypothetical protein